MIAEVRDRNINRPERMFVFDDLMTVNDGEDAEEICYEFYYHQQLVGTYLEKDLCDGRMISIMTNDGNHIKDLSDTDSGMMVVNVPGLLRPGMLRRGFRI